ncbi:MULTISPECIES: N-acetylmuramoyl-L-alanine amidase [unclassified Clostridium]|uniref:N-acetylmuramoyl-L-alanine amidase n=1 Tax=unclassified Clostridium TaxID=2614128 RepID=UPI0025BB7F26|nr:MULTISPECIES: N-acetylmuramoyl-L-alanine amidase [unclassified Clostridium]
MKIAVRGGHNYSVPGAVALLNEVVEDRKVKDVVIKYLRKEGHEVLDVTAPDSYNTINSDLSYGVDKANKWKADLFISIHFNKAYDSHNGKIGAETWVYPNSSSSRMYGQRIADKLAGLGFVDNIKKPRGVKYSGSLYELNSTAMDAVIVETCFVEAAGDVALYKKLGVDVIGKSIAEGIHGSSITSDKPINKEEFDMEKIVLYAGDADIFASVLVAQKYQCALMKASDYEAKNIKAKEVIRIGGKPNTNRYDSLKEAAKLV